MSQLRQPGDYFKHNRARTLPPHVHTFTTETNQIKKELTKGQKSLMLTQSGWMLYYNTITVKTLIQQVNFMETQIRLTRRVLAEPP